MTTPDRSVEEIVEELRNKILDIETAVRLTYNEKDSDQMINKLLNHYTKALQAGRQKLEEARKEGYATGYAQCCADNNLMTIEELDEEEPDAFERQGL